MNRRGLALAAGGLALSAIAGAEAPASRGPAPGHPVAAIDLLDTDLEYLLGEVRAMRELARAARLGAQGTAPSVREFATGLRHHSEVALAELRRIAADHGVAVSAAAARARAPELAGLAGLRALDPLAFDRQFVQRVGTQDERDALERARLYLAMPRGNPQLRAYAAMAMGRARTMIAAARDVARQLAQPDAAEEVAGDETEETSR